MKKVICILFSFLILLTSVFADKSRFYENGKAIDTLYVDSEDGLKVRDCPSLKSNRLCAVPHRLPVKVVAIGKEEAIDGITAPWVEILLPRYEWKSDNPEYGWVFGGYLNNDAANAEIFDERGFFNTGDMVSMDKNGELHFAGRKKQVIVLAFDVCNNNIRIRIQ